LSGLSDFSFGKCQYGCAAYNNQNNDAPFAERVLLWSLNAFAHVLVCAFRRDEIVFLIAASGASFESSQKRCVVLVNVMRHAPPP